MMLERARNTAVDFVADGVTALLMTAQSHHADIIRLLAGNGANLDFADDRGGTGAPRCTSSSRISRDLPANPTPTARGSSPP